MTAPKEKPVTVARCKRFGTLMTAQEVKDNGCLDWRKQICYGNITCPHLRQTKGRE